MRAIHKRGDFTDRQNSDQLFQTSELEHDSARLLVNGHLTRAYLNSSFCLLFPQQVHVVLVSFKNIALDELAISANRILKNIRTSSTEVRSVKGRPRKYKMTSQTCYTLTHHYTKNDMSVDQERQIDLIRSTSIAAPWDITENSVVSQAPNSPTRKTIQ